MDRLRRSAGGSDSLSVLDAADPRELAQIPVCRGPVDLVVAQTGGREIAWVSCFTEGAVAVVDVDRRQMVQRIPVGDKPFGIALHPDGGRVYVCVGGSSRIAALEARVPSRIVRRLELDGNPLQIAVAP